MRSFKYRTACLLTCLLLGCGGGRDFTLAPVSGTVTLDGKPLQDATVVFYPEPAKDRTNPGPASFGKTDRDGKYSATTVRGAEGAVVGTHRVTISTLKLAEGGGQPIQKEIVPAKYNEVSELTLDVPPEGTDNADFALESR